MALADTKIDADLLIGLREVRKTYGGLHALDGVGFDLRAGEVVALVGDNGAGKSTMVKMLSGVIQPDSGTVICRGGPVTFRSPDDAFQQGVATVFQNLALVDALDVARNVFLGREPSRFGVVKRREMNRRALELFRTSGIKVPSMTTTVARLSGGQRQGVAIARALLHGGAAVIMDEPTAALGVRETQHVLEIIRQLRDQGKGVVLVSHNLELVFAVADRIHVMRLGRTAGVMHAARTNRNEVVAMLMGGETAAGTSA